tara:strand:- start:1532 stop:1801 length:270 start_codon:yes stop_codon:yes gene_type:complete
MDLAEKNRCALDCLLKKDLQLFSLNLGSAQEQSDLDVVKAMEPPAKIHSLLNNRAEPWRCCHQRRLPKPGKRPSITRLKLKTKVIDSYA